MPLLANIIGLIGVGMMLYAYYLIQAKKVDAEQPYYSWLNCIGALLVLFSLAWEWNAPAFVIESAWALLSARKLWQLYRAKP